MNRVAVNQRRQQQSRPVALGRGGMRRATTIDSEARNAWKSRGVAGVLSSRRYWWCFGAAGLVWRPGL